MLKPVFNVTNWLQQDNSTAQPTPKISRPLQLTCWTKTSITEGSEYLYGSRDGLLTYRDPRLDTDLNAGFENFVKKVEEECTPVSVIVKGGILAGNKWDRTHVCTFRNNLNKICLTPLQPNDSWVVDASLVGSTLFLEIVKEHRAPFRDQDKFNYYGYHFEALCTGSATVDATSEYASVIQTKLGSLNVLMACEIDCRLPPLPRPPGQGAPAADNPINSYVELKTYRVPSNDTFRQKIVREKYPRFWVQSFLAGVQTLVMGGRDGGGILREVTRLQVGKLPSDAAAAGAPFNAWQLLRFAESVLQWMQAHGKQQPGRHMRFTYSPASRSISMQLLPDGPLPGSVRQLLDGCKQQQPAVPPAAGGQTQQPGGACAGAPEIHAVSKAVHAADAQEQDGTAGTGQEAGASGDDADGDPSNSSRKRARTS